MYLLKKLLNFPIAHSIPVLDMLRCLLRHPNFSTHVGNPSNNFNILSIVLEKLKSGNLPPIKLTGLRCLVNLFQPSCLDLIEKCQEQILENVADYAISDNKLIRRLLVRLLSNIATLNLTRGNTERKIQAVSIIAEQLSVENDEDASFFLILALGTFVHNDEHIKRLINDLDIKAGVKKLTTFVNNPQTKSLIDEFFHLVN